MLKGNILVIEDDEYSAENIKLSLKRLGYNLAFGITAKDGIRFIKENDFDLVIIDLKLPGENGITIVESTIEDNPHLKYILITGYSEEEPLVRALKIGAHDIIKKPYREEELISSVQRLLKMRQLELENEDLRLRLEKENSILKKQLLKEYETDDYRIIGKSEKLLKTLDRAKVIAQHSLDVLITGESGTGKELLARYIHKNGSRKEKAFIPVNCASLSPTLFEAELFGYEKGLLQMLIIQSPVFLKLQTEAFYSLMK